MTDESLFAEALEKPTGADRQAFLDAACGGDIALRDRVERLLAADEQTRGILDQAPVAVTELPRVIREADPPEYELAESVGEGGMGEVFRAHDVRLDRDVAVKVLHPRFPADGPAARRFLGEARVTARLQHPGVPPVHLVGALPDGRPFLAMKLIRGRTLAALLADDPADRGRLLTAFEQVCQAVAYAHSHKVVHRDLKPANVMVGAFGEVQVVDWGLAKVLGPAGGDEPAAEGDSDSGAGDATRTGSVLGTPAYMPPEQATGAVDRIDARSDAFGLGAILCAVLTGQPPYVGVDSESTRQLAARAELGDALTRLGACGADPGWVELCKRCLAAEKADRPADAGEVARAVADLRAAADERARVAELDRVRAEGERAKAEAETREQRKRRRVQLALAAALGLLLTGSGAFAWHSDRQAARQRTETEVQQRADRDRLEQNAKAVAALLDQCEAALRADEADQAALALGAAQRRAADGGAEGLAGRLADCRTDLTLLRALHDADTFRWTWADDSFPDHAAVAVRWRVALAAYGVRPEEGRAEEAARRISASPVCDRVLAALDEWLANERSAGLRAVLRAADPDPFRDAVRGALIAGDDREMAALAGRPEALVQPARFAVLLGRLRSVPPDRGRVVLETALRARTGDLTLLMALGGSYLLEGAEGAGERVRWFQAALAARPGNLAALNNLGLALRLKGDLDGAVAAYREAVRLDPNFARAHSNLGVALRAKGDLNGAVAAYREAVRADPNYAKAHYNLGAALLRQDDRAGAVAAYREAVRADPNYAKAHNSLGGELLRQGDLAEAVACFTEAIRSDPKFAAPHYNLGLALRGKGNRGGAVAAFREAVRLDPDYALAHFSLGTALWGQKNLDGAVAAFREAVRIDPKNADAHTNLGNVLRDQGDMDGAVAAFRAAVRADPRHAHAHFSLGVILSDEKRDYDGAVTAFREAIRLNPKNADAHNNLGVALRGKGDPDGAIAAFGEAIRTDPKLAAARRNLGEVLCDVKEDYDGAVVAFREAIRLDPDYANAHFYLGVALRGKGDPVGAGAAYRETVRLNPKHRAAYNNLAWLLAAGPDRVRDGRQAVEHATRACELTEWKNPTPISTLAAAHAEAGDFDRAVEFQGKALSFPAFEKRYGKVNRERLQFYARKQPYRDPDLVLREVAPPPRVLSK